MGKFKELLYASMKSKDTEEWIDIYITRPIGLAFALIGKKLGIHPNAVTVLSMILGVGAAWMFWHTDLWHNIMGVVLLFSANICDSADGQLARLTGKKTLVGRVLDGFAGDLWFFTIYFAICMRLFFTTMPGTDVEWHMWIFVLGFLSGIMSHTPQASLSDYYRQIHLFFLKGDKGSELDNSASQRAILRSLPRKQWLARLFYMNYSHYCESQEKRTPRFQTFISKLKAAGENDYDREALRTEFINGSRPLMKYTNFLTFNSRAILIYITCLANVPYIYFIIEVVVYNIIYIYMRHRHEALCKRMTSKYLGA